MSSNLQKLLKRFMDEYDTELIAARRDEDFKRPFGKLVRRDITSLIDAQLQANIYKVKGSVGAGRWTDVPWIAVFDKRITSSAQRGVYIVYLLNKDTKELYLTLNQGATDVAQGGDGSGKLAFTGIATASNGKTSISDSDRLGSTEPSKETAIFTTYDSSKGLERKICVVFDFTESYWAVRRDMPEQKYEILRNIFCVAASRGKEQIIFVEHDEAMLSEQSLSTPNKTNHKFKNMQISEMFDFKYKEDVEECFGLLDIKKIDREDTTVIKIENHEDLIDLAPCIGIYQEASFFEKYDIDKDIELYKLLNKDKKVDATKYKTLDKKILYLISLETSQNRYIRQVNRKIVEDEQRVELENRLLEIFTKQDDSQEICEIQFAKKKGGIFEFSAVGYADVIKNKVVYELKFVSELTHEHFLQCACYVVAKRLKKGVLWNTRTNDMYEISIPDKDKFLDCVAKTITKHQLAKYYKPKGGTAWLKDLQL